MVCISALVGMARLDVLSFNFILITIFVNMS
jgi:hypothetical protein